jgi:hypothetical protein
MSDISAQIEVQIPRLRRYALVLTHSQVEADELVQDCLVRALSKIHLWEPGSSPSCTISASTKYGGGRVKAQASRSVRTSRC